MARKLSVSEYGILATLFSIMYIFGVYSESIQVIIARYTAKDSNLSHTKKIFLKLFHKSVIYSIISFSAYLFLAIPLSFLLKIPYLLLFLNGFFIFGAFFVPLARGVMQGTQRFASLGINMIGEAIVKVILSISLVIIGYGVYGALIGTILSLVFALGISLFSIRDILRKSVNQINLGSFRGYSVPVFCVIFSLMAFYSLDIILAKIIFDPEVAGSYALASVIAKTIYLATYPVARVMFPLSVERANKKNKAENIFLTSFILVLSGIICAILLFFLFPEQIVQIFSGKKIASTSQVLPYVGLAISFISIANLVAIYKLSLGKIKGFRYFFVVLFVEIALLFYFSANITTFSFAFIASLVFLLWVSVKLLK